MSFSEKYIKTKDGVSLFTESIGDIKNPAIVLIMGAMNQGIFWYDSFCEALANSGFFVIRYDYRDTGFSSLIDFKNNPYDLNTLTEDVVEILDGYNIIKAHIVGISMGGYIGQLFAVNHKDKVGNLILISTTSDHRPYMDSTMGNFNNKYELPYPDKKFIEYIEKSKIKLLVPSEEEFNKMQLEGWKIMFGKNFNDLDLQELIKLIALSNERNKDKFAPFNHGLAVLNSENRIELVKNIKAPTLILHGEYDPCFPLEHGIFLNKLIPNSKLEIIKGMGHMFSLSESKIILEKILSSI